MEIESKNQSSLQKQKTKGHSSDFSVNKVRQSYSSPRGYKQGNRKRKFNMNQPENEQKRKKFEVGKRLTETDIGATEYISNYMGFSGIVKDRFSDFHVNEVCLDGSVCKLTDLNVPEMNQETMNINEMKEKLPEDIRNKIDEFSSNTDNNCKVEIDVTDLDKTARRYIHLISKSLSDVISQTEEKDKRKVLIISRKKSNYNRGDRSSRKDDMRVDWSKCDGEYLKFVLHKVNMDTMDALNQLARKLYINVSSLNYAGTKDRRGKTSQWISWKRGNPYMIQKVGKSIRGAFFGNYTFTKTPQKLGLLKGNQFKIAIKNVTAEDDKVNAVMTSLKDNGFINYYGLQRFGSIASIPTYQIGKNLLQGNWQEAVDLILKPRDEEQDRNLAKARVIYEETNDAAKAFKMINRSDKIEAKLLRGIKICGANNLQGALDYIPKNTLLMYIHSYQSLIWNTIVSKRIREFGKKPIIGDLVFANDIVDETEETEEIIDDNDKEDENKVEQCTKDSEENKVEQEDHDKETQSDMNEEKNADQRAEDCFEDKHESENHEEKMEMENKIKETKANEAEEKEEVTEKSDGNISNQSSDDKPADDKTIVDNTVEIKLEQKNGEISKTDLAEEVQDNEINNAKGEKRNSTLDVENGRVQMENGKETHEMKNAKDKIVEGKSQKTANNRNYTKELPKVRILTESDLPNYTLADVIMPMPGFKVTYPPYAKSWYDELLQKDALDTDLKMKNRKYTLSGSYRKILRLPYDLSWQIRRYEDRTEDLILSDIDEIRNVKLPEEKPDAKYKALIIKMSLPSSTYATCALREILKQDMSSETQAAKSAVHDS